MAYYVGILDGAKDVWGIRIPDVPGCYGAGATPEAAVEDAISALREVAAHWANKSVDLKAPRSIQEVIADPASRYDGEAGESIVMIPMLLDQARPVKANISLDAGLLEAIDEAARRHGLTRSAFFTSAALDRIGKAENVSAATAKLRAELAATHERLARQAAELLGEMRRLSGKALLETTDQPPTRPPRSKVAIKYRKEPGRSKSARSARTSSTARGSSRVTPRS